MMEPMEFRDRLIALLNLDRTQFGEWFFNMYVPEHVDNQYLNDKWRHFQQDPLSVMLLLDKKNFTRVAKFLLEE